MRQILISHVCDLGNSKSKEILADKNLSQFCSIDKIKSESVIVGESSTEDRESEIVQKSINTNKEKDKIDEAEHDFLWLHIIQLSMSRAILTYSGVVKSIEQA